MCSVNDEDETSELMIEKEITSVVGSICKKCLQHESEVVLRGKDPYCRTCFLAYATHKFRASLGKSKMVRKGDKILVGFSGSASSLALLHLIKAGIEETAHKRLVFEPLVVYMEDGGASSNNIMDRQKILQDVLSIFAHCNLPTCFSSLEYLFNSNESVKYYDIHTELPISSDSHMSRLFSSIECPTTKTDLLRKLRNRLLLKIAKESGCCKILTSETLASTATKLLSNISLGRGGQLPFDVGFCDNRDKDIRILRPLQDFGTEEIVFYNEIYNLKQVNTSFEPDDNKYRTSIQMLTRQFVNELQENFPSTISTVYRTGAKLNIESETIQQSEICSLCMSPLDTNSAESSSLEATKYSSLISKNGPPSNIYDSNESSREKAPDESKLGNSCNGNKGDCKCNASGKSVGVPNRLTMESLCYGCCLIAKNLISVDMLPPDIVNSIVEDSKFRQMKNEIQDFLL